MSKELYLDAHEELVAEMLETHPEMDEAKAYDMTADAAMDRMTDKYAGMIDRAHDRAKGN